MATNRELERGDQIAVVPDLGPNDPVGSGDPVCVGQLPGVALTDGDGALGTGEATVQFDGVFRLAVHGETAAGTAAIAVGDIVYLDTDGEVNIDDTNGIRYGYALEAVGDDATTTIKVKVGY
jgi:predicted RecA/RadA family phage recombinase